MKKRITFLFIVFCALLLPWQGSAQIWNIQDCLPSTLGSNIYGPMRSTSTPDATNRTAVIYQSSLLSGIAGEELTDIYFNKVTSGDMTGTPHLKIYLKETTDIDFTGSPLWNDVITGATLVYDSNPAPESAGPSGWKKFAFSNNFIYSGTQNLMLITEYYNTGNTVNTTWLYEYTSPCIDTGNSNTTKFVNNTTGTPGNDLTDSNYRRPMIGFDHVVDCPWPTDVMISNITSTGATFSWTPGGTETSWDYAAQPFGAGIPISYATTSSNPLTLTSLSSQTLYDFYVRANCGGTDGESIWMGPYTFRTSGDCSIYTLSVTANDGNVCDEGTTILTATGSGTGDAIYWYDAPSGGNLVGAGTSFETPYTTQNTSFWAAEVVNGGLLPGQAFANPTTFTNSTSNSGGLLFTVTDPIVIVDVEVFSTNGNSGDITIELRDVDNGNVTLASTTASITGGGTASSPIPQTLTLNFAVPSAGTYRLVKTASTTTVGLGYVSAANSNFPYPLGSSGEVIGGSSLTGTSTIQYFFFNWTIYDYILCESTRDEAVATVVSVDAVEASATDTEVIPGNSTTLTATSTNTNYTYVWTWDSTTGGGTGTATGASITVTPSDHTTYTVTATDTVTGCVTTDEIEILVFDTTLCSSLAVTVDDGYVCDEGTTILTATGSGTGDEIYWYDAATGGNYVGRGASFETPTLTQTTSFWASEVLLDVPTLPGQAFVDPLATTKTTSTLTNYGLIFNLTKEINIVDVEVFSTTSAGGDITIELRDINDGNATIASTTVTIPGGGTSADPAPMTVPLNFNNIPPGDYRLLKTSGPGMTTVSSTYNNFPYPLGTSGEITSGSFSTGTSTTYYYFFNWTIEEPLLLCESVREEAVATVVTVEAVEASATNTKVDPGNSTTLTATSTNTNYTYAWTWDSTTGGGTGTATGASITVTPSAHTTYTVTATDTVTGCVATDEIEILVFNTALCNTLDIVSVTDGYVCDEGTVTLTATRSNTGDEIYWYDAATGGNLLGRGASFETPELTQTTSFWAAEVLEEGGVLPGQGYVYPSTISSGSNNNQGLFFTLTEEIQLIDVEVFSVSSGGSITIELIDVNNGNTSIASATATVPGGGSTASPIPMTVPLNFTIPPGDYRLLKTSGSGPAMAYTLAGNTSFPYPIGTSGQITSGSTATGTATTYYYFFNWTISTAFALCESTREEAVATVVTIDAVEASATDTQVMPSTSTTLTATSTNANYTYEWTWDSTTGGGTGTATGASVTVTPFAHTTYTVTATDSLTGCVATDEIEILVFDITLCNTLDIVTTTDATVCEGASATLTASASGTGDEIYWYDAATGGNLVGKGASFETPELTQTTSYWAAEVLEEGSSEFVGELDPSIGTSSSSSLTNHGVNFIVHQATTIVSVDIFPTASVGTSGTIEIRDGTSVSGNIVATVPYTTTVSGTTASPVKETVMLNVSLQPGTYTMGQGNGVNLIRNTTGASYPYISPSGSVEITGHTFTNTGYWYFFYNWEVGGAVVLCESDREEAVATVISVDAPIGSEYQAFLGSETLADLDVTGTNLTWYADASGLNQLPDTTALVNGTTYYVSQTVNGCESDLLAVTALKGFVYLDNTWLPSNPSGVSTASDNIYVIDGLTTINVPLNAQDIHVMNDGTLRIEDVLHLHGDLTVDGELIFGSTPSGNGELAAVSATSTITGEVTVEHYMKDRRSYRMVSSAVTTTTSIHDNWQEGAVSRSDNPNPGYGTHITGTTIDQQNGFDATQTGNASMFTIDVPSQTFQAIANTDVNTLTAGDAYLMFIRGDRTLSNIDTPDGHTATTLRARGQLVTGNQQQIFATTTANQFVMFGNPYQSAVDINDVFANSTNVNTNQYYVYDVNIGDYGNYVTVNLPAGTNPSGSVANQYLQAGQAAQFATLSNGPTVLNFMESDKAPGNYTSNNAGANGLMSDDILNIQLYTAKNFNEGGSVHDGMAILFDTQYSNSITATDAPKAFGFGENIARDHNGTYLSIERREMPVAGEVYSLYTAGYNHQEYVFKIDLEGVTDVMMYLDDNYTGTSILLQAGVNTYSFEVGDELSQASDRFSIRTESLLNVDDPTSFAGVRLYPNPLNAETFYVHAPMLNGKEVEIRIADISGRQIYNRTLQSTSDRIEVSVNDTLSSGVYLVTIRHAGEFKTYRLIRE